MAGISEILLLLFLICALMILPRMMKPASARKVSSPKPRPLSAGLRAGIVLSVLIPVVAALIVPPWSGNVVVFITSGILPVALAWGLYWIWSARNR